MSSLILGRDGVGAAASAGDWLLSCLYSAKPDRYNDIFDASFNILMGIKAIDDRVFSLLLSCLDDVLYILNETEKKGTIMFGTKGKEPTEKPFNEILKEAEDFLLFLLVIPKSISDSSSCNSRSSSESKEGLLCSVIVQIATLKPENPTDNKFVNLRLRVLMNGFNLLSSNCEFRYAALVRIADFAVENDSFDLLLPHISQIASWVEADAALKPAQRIRMFKLLSEQLRKRGQRDTLLFKFQLMLVKEFDKLAENTKDSTAAAVELIKLSIELPEIFTYDQIIHLKPVCALKLNPDHSALYDLVWLFYAGDYYDLAVFLKNYEETLCTYQLSIKACKEKMSLLSIASIASSLPKSSSLFKNQKVPLASICEKLELTSAEAEQLVAKAIDTGVIDGLIDQINGDMIVFSSLRRSIGRLQWEELRESLLMLNSNLSNLQGTMQKYSTIQ